MPDNRDEIVANATALATDILRHPENYPDDAYATAGDILALASPPEPKRWPGMAEAPYLSGCAENGYYVFQCDHGRWTHHGPLCPTPAAAVAAWNVMIDRIAGPDEETVRLVGDLAGMLNHPDADVLHRARRWLAERTGGADAK